MAEGLSRRLTAILAADIAGYSALMGSDDERTVHDLKAHQSVVLPMIGDFGGRIIDTAGDGFLVEFASVVKAMECAVAIQVKMAQRNSQVEPDWRMQFRIGVNIGDVIYDETRIFGDEINVAARLENIAEPGGICISSKVYEEVRGRSDLTFQNIGEQQFKNIALPVLTYRVNLPNIRPDDFSIGGTTIGPASPEKRSARVSYGAAPLPAVKPHRLPANARGDGLTGATRREAGWRLFVTFAVLPIVALLVGHYVIVMKLDLDTGYLRAYTLLVGLLVGFALSWHAGGGLGTAFILGATTGFTSVLAMLVVVGLIDGTPIIPSSIFEWQESIEYAVEITLAVMIGNAVARVVENLRSARRKK